MLKAQPNFDVLLDVIHSQVILGQRDAFCASRLQAEYMFLQQTCRNVNLPTSMYRAVLQVLGVPKA